MLFGGLSVDLVFFECSVDVWGVGQAHGMDYFFRYAIKWQQPSRKVGNVEMYIAII
jgi:hypothetical protein